MLDQKTCIAKAEHVNLSSWTGRRLWCGMGCELMIVGTEPLKLSLHKISSLQASLEVIAIDFSPSRLSWRLTQVLSSVTRRSAPRSCRRGWR